MRKIIMAIAAAIMVSTAHAQEITSSSVDSTFIYNYLNNPNDYSQAPTTLPQRKVLDRSRISTNINMGTSFSTIGMAQYINPAISYQATDRLHVSIGMGMMYSTLNLSSMEGLAANGEKIKTHTVTNYYSASASYQLSPRSMIYGSIIYAKNLDNGNNALSPYFNKDRYMATFGANFNITESLSIGFEVRKAQNMSPYYMYDRYNGPMGW